MRSDFRNHPYGAYVAGNSSVIFDRRYRPIVRIDHGVTVCDPLEWVEHSDKEWFYDDATAPRYCAETRAKLKRLMDAIPEMAAEVRRRYAAERKARAIAPPRRWPGEHHTQLYGL
jgi:hypothetical protein